MNGMTPAFAEEAVIGGLLLDNMRLHDVAAIVSPEHFTGGGRGDLFRAIKDRVLAGEPADTVTIGEALPDLFDYAIHLASSVPGASQVVAYAGIVRNNWRRREAVQIALRLQSGARGGEDGVVDQAIAELLALSATVSDCEHTGKQAMQQAWREVEAAYANGGALSGIPTGIEDLNDILGGWHDSDLTIIGGRPAMGKEQPNSSLVLLESGGWVRMGDIRIGDALASVDGEPSHVTGVFPQGFKDVYEFTFSDGRTARAGIDHLWEVNYRDWKSPRVLNTAEILKKLESKRYQNRLSVRLISGKFGAAGSLPLDPWLLGFLLGDGNFTDMTPRFSTADSEVLERVISLLPDSLSLVKCGKYDYRISGAKGRQNWMRTMLEDLNLWGKYSHEKRIPADYMRASRSERLELMQGLIDSDGWVEKFNCIRFSSSSLDFARDVQALARSLGAICSIGRKSTAHMDAHILTIRCSGQSQFAWLKRKADRIREPKFTLRLTISSVEPVGSEESTCIRVSHPTSLYVTDSYVVTHNTAFLGGLVEACAASGFKPGLFSAEQPAIQMAKRRLSMLSGVSATKLRTGAIEEADWARLQSGMRDGLSREMMIYDRSAITLDELVSTARKWKHTHGVGAIFIDYAQRITIPGADRISEVSQIARGLKNLGRDLNIPIIALGQVKAAVESREDKRPLAGDLANSDELVREADQIIMLYRDEVYNRESPDKGIAEVLIEKNRHGPTGFKRIRFDSQTMTFSSLRGGAF